MSQPDATRESLLRIADELRDLSARLNGVVGLLTVYAAAADRQPAPQPPVDDELDGMWANLPTAPEPDGERWDRWGGRVLAWAGGAVTVLGVVLLLVLAVQRGWLGPGPRLLCGAGLAAVLLAVGVRVHRSSGGQAGAFALAATGFAALFLDAVAATALYHYLPVAGGLLAALAVAAAGLFLADRWRSPSLALFVVLAAAACAPIVIGAVTALLVGFLLVLAGAATPVRLRRQWRYLAIAAEGPPLVASLVLDRVAHGADVPGAVVVACVTTVACLALAVGTVLRDNDDPVASGVLVVAPVPVMAAAPLLAKAPSVGALAAVTVLLFGIWAVGRLPRRFRAAAGIAGAVTLCQATLVATVTDTATLSITLLCQAMLFALTARGVARPGPLVVAACYAVGGTAAALAGPARLALLVVVPVTGPSTTTLGTAAAVGALVLLTVVVLAVVTVRLPVPRTPVLWSAGGVVALYGFSTAVLCIVMLAAPNATGFRVGHLVITLGWTVCAFVLLAKGIRALPARIAGLSLVGAAVVKLFAFDLVQLDGIIRVGAFLGTGVVLLLAGVRYARMVASSQTQQLSSGS